MRILGMVTHTHDSGVALIKDGEPEIVIEEERLNREKKTQRFPAQALEAALTNRGLSLADVDCITMPWDIPRFWKTLTWAMLRKFPRSLNLAHVRAHPPQQNQLFRGSKYLAKRLCEHFDARELPPIHYVGHHHAHAASYFVSPFEDATVVVMDGYGDDSATSVYVGRGNELMRVSRSSLFNSLGILYTVVTQYLGFKPNQDEGKVMGLAAYGRPSCVDAFRDVLRLKNDGGYQVNMKYFWYDCYGLARALKPAFVKRFGPARNADDALTGHHQDIAFALQTVVEEAILNFTHSLARKHPSTNLVLTGGVALNCVANAKILEQTNYKRIWIPPNASDTGAPLGSALWHYHQRQRRPRTFELKHPHYGVEYSDEQIEKALREAGLSATRLPREELLSRTAHDIADGKIVGWFQGRFEMGPRALGNRSILADARRVDMKDVLNSRVKHREPFRPFAPVILAERVQDWFDIQQTDPFMTIAPTVWPQKAPLIPSGIHADDTARIQTIERSANDRYYDLIAAFEEITGVPIILNTSFNRQEPIVARPEEAISCFLRTDMDTLVLGDFYCTDRNPRAISQAAEQFEQRTLVGANL